MKQQKKKRGQNWSSEEKEMLRQLIAQSAPIIENKNMNTSANLLKAKEWNNITKKLNKLSGKHRSDVEIKLAWKRMKMVAKANLSAHWHQQCSTEGGEKIKSPTHDHSILIGTMVHHLKVESNVDSDAAHIAVTNENDEQVCLLPQTSTSTELASPKIKENLEVKAEIVEDTPEEIPINKSTLGRTTMRRNRKRIQNKTFNETLNETISKSHAEFKNRQMQLLEEEHSFKIQVYKLQIRKLELEIALLENKNSNTNE